MQAHPNQFYYNPLPASHIRLCFVPPRSSIPVLCGAVFDVNIAKCGNEVKYNALSYTWGDATKTTYLRLLTSNHARYLKVTTSVIEALENSRHNDHPMAFWVDQICIDQSNTAEKESQIRLMKLIYERAGSVFAWIGPAADNSDIAMDTILSDERRSLMAKQMNTVREGSLDSAELGEAAVYTAIVKLMQRPWWNRTWILQEATAHISSQTLVCCGAKQAELSKFYDVISFLQHRLIEPNFDRAAFKDLYDTVNPQGMFNFQQKRRVYPLRPMLELLEHSRHTNATDSRDKIYVMIPFSCESATSSVESSLNMNYMQLPEEAYVEFALWHIHTTHSLDILGHCSVRRKVFTDVISTEGRILTEVGTQNTQQSLARSDPKRQWYNPSWVPDWRQALECETLPKRGVLDDPSSDRLFNASGKQPPLFVVPATNRGLVLKLVVLGIRVARVGAVLDTVRENTIEQQLHQAWTSIDESEKHPTTDRTMRETLIRTVFTDLKAYQTSNQELAWRRAIVIDRYAWPGNESTSEDQEYDMVLMRRHCVNRCIFHTEPSEPANNQRLLGLGSAWIQTGDELWILQGSSVPVILRPREVEYDTNNPTLDLSSGTIETRLYQAGKDIVFEVMGECFVDGLMDGEILEMLGPEPRKSLRPAYLKEMQNDFSSITLT